MIHHLDFVDVSGTLDILGELQVVCGRFEIPGWVIVSKDNT